MNYFLSKFTHMYYSQQLSLYYLLQSSSEVKVTIHVKALCEWETLQCEALLTLD